jgi:hypothetical protein
VLRHRLVLRFQAAMNGVTADQVIAEVVSACRRDRGAWLTRRTT